MILLSQFKETLFAMFNIKLFRNIIFIFAILQFDNLAWAISINIPRELQQPKGNQNLVLSEESLGLIMDLQNISNYIDKVELTSRSELLRDLLENKTSLNDFIQADDFTTKLKNELEQLKANTRSYLESFRITFQNFACKFGVGSLCDSSSKDTPAPTSTIELSNDVPSSSASPLEVEPFDTKAVPEESSTASSAKEFSNPSADNKHDATNDQTMPLESKEPKMKPVEFDGSLNNTSGEVKKLPAKPIVVPGGGPEQISDEIIEVDNLPSLEDNNNSASTEKERPEEPMGEQNLTEPEDSMNR